MTLESWLTEERIIVVTVSKLEKEEETLSWHIKLILTSDINLEKILQMISLCNDCIAQILIQSNVNNTLRSFVENVMFIIVKKDITCLNWLKKWDEDNVLKLERWVRCHIEQLLSKYYVWHESYAKLRWKDQKFKVFKTWWRIM